MPRVHEAIGYVVLGVFTVAWIWGGAALVLRRDPGERFWVWITVEQVIAGIQAIVGIVLLVLGYRPETWLHYVYGFGPLVILGIAHVMSREVTGTSLRVSGLICTITTSLDEHSWIRG